MRIAARFTTRRTFAYSELIGAGRRLQYEAAAGPVGVGPVGRTEPSHWRAALGWSAFTCGDWWSRLGSNQRPSACEADALPLSHGTGAETANDVED